MLQDFIYRNPTKVYFGKNCLDHLGEEAAACGKRALLVYGGGSIRRNGVYDKVCAALRDAGIEWDELSGVEPNPRHTTANRGAALCKEKKTDLVVAVGGGSVIDCAKAVAATAVSDSTDCYDFVTGGKKVTAALPILAVVTIAATGSEMNNIGVISNWEKNHKASLRGECLFPRVSFLNPEFTYSVNAYQTASGSADIMSHIFDTMYFAQAERMELLYGAADEVLKTVVRYAPVALKEPENYEARANLMWAASWALNGFVRGGLSQTTVCHKLEHELSAFYDVTHGHGLAILIPRFLEYGLNEKTAPQIRRLGVNVLGVDPSLPVMEGAKASIEALKAFFFGTLGLASRLSDLGIGEENIPLMAKKACSAGKNGVISGLYDLTEDDAAAIYRMSL